MTILLRRASRAAVAFLFLSASTAGAACQSNVATDGAHGSGNGGQGGGDGTSSGSGGSAPIGAGDDAGITCTPPDGSPDACQSNPCATFPTGGTPCTTEWLTCSDVTMFGDTTNFAVCYDGTWANRSCLGYACGCPGTLPTLGSACDACCGQPCPYPDDAGLGPTLECAPNGIWVASGPG